MSNENEDIEVTVKGQKFKLTRNEAKALAKQLEDALKERRVVANSATHRANMMTDC